MRPEDDATRGEREAPPGPPEPRRRGHAGAWVRLGVLVAVAAGVAALLRSAPKQEDAPASESRSARVATVQVEPARVETVTERATYPGELVTQAVDVAARVAGRLASVGPRVGDHLEAGETVAQVDVAELEHQLTESRAQQRAAKAAGRRARSELAAAGRELGRTKGLVKDQLVSQQQVDTLQARVEGVTTDAEAADAQHDQAAARVAILQQRIEDATVTAPLSGVVSRRMLDGGAYVQVGAPILRLVAQRPLRVQFEVPERDVALLHDGRSVAVRTQGTGALEVWATVRGVGGEVDRQRRTVLLEADVPEPPDAWLSGMSAEVVSATRTLEGALTVAGVAVVERLDEAGDPIEGIFVVEGERARWVPVRVEGREDTRVAIEAAVQPGAQVIVRGHGDLSDGALVRLAERER